VSRSWRRRRHAWQHGRQWRDGEGAGAASAGSEKAAARQRKAHGRAQSGTRAAHMAG
jgi:hypothetical protein